MSAPSVAEVVALYERWGTERYDEDVSQLDHGLQTAARAQADGADDPLVVAALLHDVGHLLELRDGRSDPTVAGDPAHEASGARYLAGRFPAAVTAPIALHVRAKRYLAAVEPGFIDALSLGSQRSLVRQGGPLRAEEVRAFERHPNMADAIRLRRWDDAGKVVGSPVPALADHAARLASVAS